MSVNVERSGCLRVPKPCRHFRYRAAQGQQIGRYAVAQIVQPNRLNGAGFHDVMKIGGYAYNGDGTRSSKTVDNTTTQYYYVNGRLHALTKDIYTAFFLYDDTGRPYAVRLTILPEGHTYPMYVMAYYKYNLQGDVVGLYSSSGQEFVTYTYDPFGNKPIYEEIPWG